MIIDLPPGTGDVQLSLSQLCEFTGSVIVSTPQDVSLLDAKKAISMFDKVEVEITGIIENMSNFVCPHCGKSTPIFSENGPRKISKEIEIPFLGSIPIEIAVREGSDRGLPIMQKKIDSPASIAFNLSLIHI